MWGKQNEVYYIIEVTHTKREDPDLKKTDNVCWEKKQRKRFLPFHLSTEKVLFLPFYRTGVESVWA